jgi:hypothetical protein
MGFNKLYYGKSNPSWKRIITINLIWISLFLIVVGIRSQFLPSKLWLDIGLKTTYLLCFIISIIYFCILYKRKDCLYNKSITYKGYVFIIIFVPLFSFSVLWLVVLHGIPSVITYIAGESIEKNLLVGKSSGGSRICQYRLQGFDLNPSAREYLCISRDSYYNYTNKFNLHTKGKQTIFGYYILLY